MVSGTDESQRSETIRFFAVYCRLLEYRARNLWTDGELAARRDLNQVQQDVVAFAVGDDDRDALSRQFARRLVLREHSSATCRTLASLDILLYVGVGHDGAYQL